MKLKQDETEKLLKEFENKCDHCLMITNMASESSKAARLTQIIDLLKLLNEKFESQKVAERRFTK